MTSDTNDDFGFAPPAFKPEDALLQLKRALRDLKLAERGNGFELRGKRVLELQVSGSTIAARIARRLVTTPEWDRFEIKAAPDQRRLVDEVSKRLVKWERDE